jgi:hypothetical protein
LLKQVPDEKPTAPPDPITNPAGFSAYLKTLNEDELNRFIKETIDKCYKGPGK